MEMPESLDILVFIDVLDNLDNLDKLEFTENVLIFFNINIVLIIFCNFYAIKYLFLHMIYGC